MDGREIYKFKARDCVLCLGTFQKTDQQIIWKKQALMNMCMILVLILMLFQLMILKTFINTWWRKIIWYDKYVHTYLKYNSCKVTYKNVCIY